MTQLTLNLQGDLEATGEMKTLSSPVASLNYANHSHSLESGKARMMNATCGEKCYEQFKKLNRDSSSLKMSMVSQILMADWYSSKCALTWKLKGTKFNRLLFQLVPKTLPTAEIGAGLLLTPTTSENVQDLEKFRKRMKKYPNGTTIPNLATQLHSMMLPTPTSGNENSQHSLAEWGGSGNLFRQVPGAFFQLNTRFVAEMMGFPKDWTELPFQNGDSQQ